MIIAIKQDDLDKWWPQVVQFIEKALTKGYGEMDIDDIHTMLEEEQAILMLAIIDEKTVAGIVVQIIEKPALREFILLTAGGEELDKWLSEFHDAMVKLAKEQQADIMVINGRRGWVKKLQAYGFEEAYTTVIKRL